MGQLTATLPSKASTPTSADMFRYVLFCLACGMKAWVESAHERNYLRHAQVRQHTEANILKKAGVSPEQAEAQAEALSDVLEVNLKELATKGDLALMRKDLDALEQRMTTNIEKTKVELIKWNIGAIIAAAGLAMAIARLFFPH